ncbi:DNA-binding response OmpR family regulator [Novosphingobium hassiacum]|uniref:DNA-binding response OmpR family regulator n=2 Tax=Novosphingobium hassiacum TaxID=173676 RepID=A0A7W6EXU5_9SPHN|nr:DNA-binding response OmpR family regulator [Novosphingobium hassiacum]
MPDRAAALRRAWLDDVVDCDQQYNHSQDPVGYLSQARDAFSVLLVSGDDLPRIYAILREVREILPSKAVVPVLRNCPPARAMAALLRRGAADILHCRMPPREGTARLHAIIRRIEWAEGRRLSGLETGGRRREKVRSIACQSLTPMEEQLLAVLIEREGRIARYTTLAPRPGAYWGSQSSRKSIHVTISHLRRKLRAGFRIKNCSGLGYILTSEAVLSSGVESVHV